MIENINKRDNISSKIILKNENKNINKQMEINKNLNLEKSIINNNDNILNINNGEIIIQSKSNINNNNFSLNDDFLITSLPEIKNNSNNNLNKNEINKETPKKFRFLTKHNSTSNITTDNNNIRYNKIINKNYSYLKKINITEREKEEDKFKIFKSLRDKELIRIKNSQIKINNKMNILYKNKDINYSSFNKYLYMSGEEKEKQRLAEEEFEISIENEKRKLKLSPISIDELNQFSQEVKKNQKLLKVDLEIKKLNLNSLWKERKKLLPNYKSKFLDLSLKYDEEKKNLENNKKEIIRKEANNKKNFGEIIYKNFQPKIFDKLKIEREQKIKELNGIGRYDKIKNLSKKLKMISKKIYNSQPKNFKINNKLVIEKINNKKIPLLKPIDYLAEIKKNNEQNQLSSRLNNDKRNIPDIKMEAKILEEKAKEKKLLLKYEKSSGNIQKIDKLSSEISQLYYNSIQAKLKILNKINNE